MGGTEPLTSKRYKKKPTVKADLIKTKSQLLSLHMGKSFTATNKVFKVNQSRRRVGIDWSLMVAVCEWRSYGSTSLNSAQVEGCM